MKIRTVLIVALAAIFALPALACGPGMSNNNTGTGGQMSSGRDSWTKKRIRHLKGEMEEQKKADRTARTLDRILGGADNNVGRVMFPQGASSAAQRQNMINRYEFL